MSEQGQRQGWNYLDVALFLVGIAGLAASLTILWLGMRAVLGVGGFCAEGGPYVITQHCPEGTAWLIPLAVFAGLGSAGLTGWEGSKLGAPWGGIVGLAWPGLFISLGWNFLEFAFFPPEGMDGIQLGWLIPGILFVIMGAFPLIGFLPGGKSWQSNGSSATFAFADQEDKNVDLAERRTRLLNDLVDHADVQPNATHAAQKNAADDDLVSKLERLDALHRSGSLTYDEFQKAKQELINGGGPA